MLEELNFYNPWGNKFDKTYEQVAIESSGLALIEAPITEYVATEAFIANIRSKIPKFSGNFLALSAQLDRSQQPHKLIWCSRRDTRNSKRFA